MSILEGRTDILVAVVDLRMPGMGGEEFILKAHTLQPDLRFIIQTGTLGYEPGPQLNAIGVTIDNLLKKPILKLDTYIDLIEKLTN